VHVALLMQPSTRLSRSLERSIDDFHAIISTQAVRQKRGEG
jgi:hypothetical protein